MRRLYGDAFTQYKGLAAEIRRLAHKAEKHGTALKQTQKCPFRPEFTAAWYDSSLRQTALLRPVTANDGERRLAFLVLHNNLMKGAF
jgi:hypothetical protein